MEKKYEITDEWFPLGSGIMVYRIRALRDFSNVKAGDLGGFIEKEENLSHDGDCWVYDDGCVYGNARVFENAKISGCANVFENAKIFGNSSVYGHASVEGSAQVYDHASVYEFAKVSGQSKIYGYGEVCRSRIIFGSEEIYNKPIHMQKKNDLKEIKINLGSRIVDAITLLRAHKNSFINFNGEVINSEMTDDEIYIKTTGKNKNDFLLLIEKKEKEHLISYIKNQISICNDMDKLKKIAKILDVKK